MASYTAAHTGNPNPVTIPLVDFSDFAPDNLAAKERITRELMAACHDVGFVYITNHGVPQDMLAKIFEPRIRLARSSIAAIRGRGGEGVGAISETDYREAIAKLREVQDFKAAGKDILRALAIGMGLPDEDVASDQLTAVAGPVQR
ncbi:hypothetical protein DV736_g4216, partial [Chaetothyriales sp. CBS 134916]